MCSLHGKNSLAYDLQELFRFLVDLAVINLIKRDEMGKNDFIRTENYSLRLRPTGARKMTAEVNAWLNKTTEYQGKECAWSYLILLKTRELAHYLAGKKKCVNFCAPVRNVLRNDTKIIREQILRISYKEWQEKGFSKGTLHYMKQNAKNVMPFTLNRHVRERLALFEQKTT